MRILTTSDCGGRGYFQKGAMMDKDEFDKVFAQLRSSGRINEILDDNGQIKPSASSLREAEFELPNGSDADRWRLAQAGTLIELAEKYAAELNQGSP
jgi:hypothetical protein